MPHYFAVAERGQDRSWWISFPGQDDASTAAVDVGRIVPEAQVALAAAAMDGGLPLSIEDGATPPTDLSEFEPPFLVVVIPGPGRRTAPPTICVGPSVVPGPAGRLRRLWARLRAPWRGSELSDWITLSSQIARCPEVSAKPKG